MQDIYTYIPEKNYVRREYSVAAILLLLFTVLILLVPVLTLLYFHISTFRSMCAVPNMAVFCSSMTSWFPRMLLTYFLNDYEMVPVAPNITGITFVFYIPHALYFYCKKAVPLQSWIGPEGSRKLRFPHFMTTAQDCGKVVSLTHRPPLPPGNAPGNHFC